MRLLVLALWLTTTFAQAKEQTQRKELALTILGEIFLVGGAAGLATMASAQSCEPTFGGAFGCALPRVYAGGGVAAGSLSLAIPFLASGLTLRRLRQEDEFALREGLPPEFFAERAARRRRLGRNLAIAGAATSLVAIGCGIAFLTAFEGPTDPWFYPTVGSLGTIGWVASLALLSTGLTLWTHSLPGSSRASAGVGNLGIQF